MTRSRRAVPVVALLLGLLASTALMACGDDDDDSPASPAPATATAVSPTRPSESPTTAATPTRTPAPKANRTGNPAIDTAIDAVEAKDAASLVALVQYVKVECTSQPPQGPGGPPDCPPGVADKTAIEVFPASVCQGFYSDAGKISGLFQSMVDEAPRIIAVYKNTDPGTASFPAGETVLLFERTTGTGKGWMTSVEVNAQGKIVRQAGGCAQTPAQRLQERVPTANIILGPVTY